MANSLVMSLIGAASLAAALLVGCGDKDAAPVSSKAGQSCARTADCTSGLSCIANVCYATAPVAMGQGGAKTTVTPPGPVLGGDGESCTSHTDCTPGLGCFNQRCTVAAMGEGGAGNTVAPLGSRGESCTINGDCVTGLVCIPSNIGGTGVCDLASDGLQPSLKICGGECNTPADCCQLPLEQQDTTTKSCEDIDARIKDSAVDCTSAAAGRLCFLQATYCKCTAKTWACTDNACVYGGACTVQAAPDMPKGCPTFTRLGRAVPSCNAKSLKCQGGTAADACATAADCLDGPVADDVFDSCSAGECTCYAGDHKCYRQCAKDLDCAAGKVCDTKSSVCVPSDRCVTDTQCALAGLSLDFKCNKGTCARSCTGDRDCSGTGHTGTGTTFNGQVCGTEGFCVSLAGQCTDDIQCSSTKGLKTFCVDKPAAAGTTVSSAITN